MMKYKKLLLIACVIILLWFGFEKLTTQYSNKFISPDKTNTIKVQSKESFNFLLFGPSNISITCRKNNLFGFITKLTIDTTISNDGKSINDSNVNIEWISEDIAIITLLGEEQNDEVIKVNFEDDISYE